MSAQTFVFILVVIAILAFTSPIWFGDAFDVSARALKKQRGNKSLRRYPTFPVQGGKDADLD